MEKNGILRESPYAKRLSPAYYDKLQREEEERRCAEAAQAEERTRYLAENSTDGVLVEAGNEQIEVDGYSGSLQMAPAISRAERPTKRANTLWIENVKAGAKGTFLIYSPTFWGYFTHYRGKGVGQVLCFEDRALCVGGHTDESMRWHGLLHAYHYEKDRQVFVRFTPEGEFKLREQVRPGVSLRGLKLTVRRSESEKGPFYVSVDDHAKVPLDKLPQHRDPRASLFRFMELKDTGRVRSAALSGGEYRGNGPLGAP